MKYYRVKKDTFLLKEGAIIRKLDDQKGYQAIEDIWNAVPCIGSEYITASIVEHPDNSDFFERVYTHDIKGKIFRTKDELVAMYKENFA